MISILQMRTLRFLSVLWLDSVRPLFSSEVFTKVSDNKEPKTRTWALFIHSLIRLLLWVLFIGVFVCAAACMDMCVKVSFIGYHPLCIWVSFSLVCNLATGLGQLARKPRSSSLDLRSHYHWDCNSVPPGPDFNIGSGHPNFSPHACGAGSLLTEPSSLTPPPFVFTRQDLAM